MRKIIFLLLLILPGLALVAQQEEQYTQFMYYKLGLNPGYAGSTEGISISALARSQWLGLDGAPETQLLSFSMPVWNNRLGLGMNILRQSIGVTQQYTIDGIYAYRVRIPRGFLGMGLQTSIRSLRTDFSKLQGNQPVETDQAISNSVQTKMIPNFGVGLYYESEKFFIGASVPRLLRSNIDLADNGGTISREVTHLYFMTGILLPLSEGLKLQPQLLLKYVQSAPFDGDLNLSLLILDRFTTGVSYRLGGSQSGSLGEAFSVLVGAQIGEKIMFGLSYDATLSELRQYTSGTVEGVLRFYFTGSSKGDTFDSPRPFYF